MRIILAHPGASWSVADVWAGIKAAMERQGTQVIHYALDGRLQYAMRWLDYCYRHNPHKDSLPRPNQADAMYLASVGLIERALRLQPDWVVIISGMWLHPDILIMLRRAGIRAALIYTESPYEDDWQIKLAPYVEALWVNERTSLPRFQAVNPHSYYWQHALDPGRHHPENGEMTEGIAAHDVVFVGTGFYERIKLLGAVNWAGLDLGLYGTWQLLGSRNPLRQYLRGGVVRNEITAALYRRAKVGLNLHRTSVGFGRDATQVTVAESLNPRAYELAADGCFFISDYRAELPGVFGGAVPTFRDMRELEEQIRYWVAHDDERRARAATLPGLVAGHTFDARVAQMLGVLQSIM